jgi:hypothetical protein
MKTTTTNATKATTTQPAGHTPGPWKAIPNVLDSAAQSMVILDAQGKPLAMAYDAANAPLIQGAPDLIAALERLLPILDNDGPLPRAYDDVGEIARAAIARARGLGVES